MSVANYFETRRRAYKLREKEVTTTYTVRVGGSSDNFIEDRVITVPSASSAFTITVPDGKYRGQRLLVAVTSTSTMSNNATVSTGTDNYKLKYAGNYVSLEWAGTGDKGWIYVAKYAQ